MRRDTEHDGSGRIGGGEPEGVRARVGPDHLIVMGGQDGREETVDRWFIVYDQNAGHWGASISGRRTVIRAPRPPSTGLSAEIAPWCASTIPFAMARPSPVLWPPSPRIGACTNLSNARGRMFEDIPGPSSVTDNSTSAPSRFASSVTWAFGPA